MVQLAEAGFDTTDMALGEHNRYIGDDKLYVRFHTHPKQSKSKTAEAGRPIFVDTEYVTIMVPGDKTSIVSRPAYDRDKQRFAKQYAAFKNNQDDVLVGTPLEQWPGIKRSQVEEMKYFNIRTVEQLADLSDTHSQQFMGVNELKKRAQAFLAAAEDNAANEKLAAELAIRDDEITALKQAVEELKGLITKKD